MAEEEPKKKINFKKIALFGLGPIVLIGIGLGVGAFSVYAHTNPRLSRLKSLLKRNYSKRVNCRVPKVKMRPLLSQKKYIRTRHLQIRL